MQKLFVCIGSSCHLKGSYYVLERIKVLIEEGKLGNKIELAGSFCLGNCAEGVSMKFDNQFILNASPDNIDEVFKNQILPKVK